MLRRARAGARSIARRADLVVQPTGPGVDDLDPAILLFHELTRAGIPVDRLAMALCRVEELARRYVEKAGYMILPGSILERRAYREAHNRGLSISELKTAAMYAVSMRANYLYGYGIGQSPDTKLAIAWANVAADLWKGFGLIVAVGLWRCKSRRAAIVISLTWLVCLCFSVSSQSAFTSRNVPFSPARAKCCMYHCKMPSENSMTLNKN